MTKHTYIFLKSRCIVVCILASLALLTGCSYSEQSPSADPAPSPADASAASSIDLETDIPEYSGQDYIELNGGVPSFSEEDMAVPDGTEIYGELDSLGRATFAFAKVCGRTRPAEDAVRNHDMPDPTGFIQAKYPDIDLDHLYDRTHLIAYSLTDEATEPRDLITGTKHMNQDVMTVFEKRIRDQIAEMDMASYTENHVLMRVTPDFRGTELVARGVQIEALSLEDTGESIRLNVYCYNIQPGVLIDYATGESCLESPPEASSIIGESEQTYILNTNTKRFHHPDCDSTTKMKPENRQTVEAERSDLISQGYEPCGTCDP